MDLPNLFSSNTDVEDQLTVIFIHLTSIKIQSFLLSISNEGVDVLEKSKVFEYEKTEDCLIKVDESLQQLGKKSESISSVIFGLNHSWVKNGEITKDKKPLLKRITDELSLKPLGFIVISEAIVQQKISQNSMFSGIVSVLNEKNLIFSLVYQGKIKTLESVGRSSDKKGDFLEGLARFSTKSEKSGFYLPTKIFLASMDLNKSDLKNYQQSIYDFDWSSQPQFLQPPTVEIIAREEYENMITREAAKAVALQNGMTQAAMAVSVSKNGEAQVNDETKATELDSGDLGFSDVKIEENEYLDERTTEPTSFGVPISSKKFDKELSVDNKKHDNLHEPDFKNDAKLAVDISNDNENNKKHKLKKEEKHYKNFKLYGLVGFIAGLVALLIIGFFSIIYSATAELTVNLKSQPIFKDLEITLDTTIKETDIDNLILAAGKITGSGQSESKMQVTGVEIVGEKSKGKVSVYNKTVAEKFLAKGTVLSVGELKFELDDDVTIASASSSQGITEHGKTDANVTALQIGAESNLAKDTELTVEPFDKSSYYAYVIDEDFTGGSSREVRVVSSDDRKELLSDLRKELIKKINKDFEKKSEDGIYVLPSNNIISEEPKFNFEVGDEAEELSLNLKIELEAATYTADELKPLATKVLASQIPDNYKLSDSSPQILSAPTESDLDELDLEKPITLSANISSFAIPDLSIESLRDEIIGKNINDVKTSLESKDEIEKVEIVLKPNIANSFVKKIPKNKEKIKIEFKNE